MKVYDNFPQSVQGIVNWIQQLSSAWMVLLQISFIATITFILSLAVYLFYKRIYDRLKKTNNLWDDLLIFALHKPLQFLIWVFGLLFALQSIVNLIPHFEYNFVFPVIRNILVVIAIVWFLLSYIKLLEARLINKAQAHHQLDRATTFAMSRLMRIGVVLIAVLILLQIIGVPIAGLVAFGGVGALIIGLASKELLENLFGGLMIFTDRHFMVGDTISSPDRNIEGAVEAIGWRLTRIRNADRQPIYVPNSVFSSIIVVNFSRMYNRRISKMIGLRYSDFNKIKPIQQDIVAMLKAHAEIDQEMVIVRFSNYGASSLEIQIIVLTKTADWLKFLAIQEDVLFKIAAIIAKHGAEFAYPTYTVEIPDKVAITNDEELTEK